jgi:tryptophan synthase beta chain
MKEEQVYLGRDEIPRRWYNIHADMPKKLDPPLHPVTKQPARPEDLAAIFAEPLIEQEMSLEPWITIPDEVLDVLALWRPTPLTRARHLEAALGTPAQIWYKYEGVSPAGSHKPNTAVAQAYFNKIAGTTRLATETGAGQWGAALSFACCKFGLECKVYMVKVSYHQKPYRRSLMHVWGGQVVASPSADTQVGRSILEKDPDCPGSLGIAISEAIEDTVTHPGTKYCLGSVLNHVCLHQTVVGLETREQLRRAGIKPDILIGCCGGGSNFAGFVFPFAGEKLRGEADYQLVGVEPAACPTLTRGEFRYDYGDTAGMTPLLPMYTLGHDFMPAGIHAGGLRYHGMAPLMSELVREGVIEARSAKQLPTFEAAVTFARAEGIVPAPESAHAIRAAIDEAIRAREEKTPKVIVFCLSGHGFLDLASYDAYFAGKLEDYEYDPSAEEKK